MLLTVNNDSTRRVTSADVALLAECDHASCYEECGYFCLIGFQGTKRVVHAHANNRAEFESLCDDAGYRWTGCGMVKLTPEQMRDRRSSFDRFHDRRRA